MGYHFSVILQHFECNNDVLSILGHFKSLILEIEPFDFP